MIIKSFTGGPFHTNCYIVIDNTSKECCLIDCPHETFDRIADYIEKNELTLTAVYLTHSHFDHIGDLAMIKEKFSSLVYVHIKDKENVENPGSDGIPLFTPTSATKVDKELKEGQILRVGCIELKVIETPGHSPGSVSFYCEKKRVLFDGDVIFKQGRGRTDLPGCDEELLFKTIKKILLLDDDVVIYSGHGEKTTIGEERSYL